MKTHKLEVFETQKDKDNNNIYLSFTSNTLEEVHEQKKMRIKRGMKTNTIKIIDVEYCGFNSVWDLINDHKKIKNQIKEWEKKIDDVYQDDDCNRFLSEELESIAHEMMAINL